MRSQRWWIAAAAIVGAIGFAFAQSGNNGGIVGPDNGIKGPSSIQGPNGGISGPAGGIAGPGGQPAAGGGGSCTFGALDFSQSGCNIMWMGG